jgi:poly(3-hydroxybutyrate) depolymerase
MKRRRGIAGIACAGATLLVSAIGFPAFAYDAVEGRVDLAPITVTGGAEIFVYVPDGIDGNAVLTEPILMVYGDEDFTESSAAETAEASGLAALAQRENSVVAFVNSIGDEWGQADADAYQVYAGALFAERDNQAGGGRWDAATNRYSNGKYSGYTGHRYYAIAEGAGADFVSGFLVDDALDTAYGWGGRSSAMPANIMLFNTTAVPTKGTIDFEYPVIVVNGSSQVNDEYASLNKNSGRVVTLTSDVTDGFDNAIVAAQFDKLISVRRSNVGGATNNTAIFDLPVYSALGVEVVEKTVTLGTANRMYLTYLPESVKHAAPGTVPMVLAMHGAGEKAEYYALLSAWPEVAAKEGFIVVSVDNHTAITNNNHWIQLLEGVFDDYPQIDQSRVYASGFSMGSMGSFNRGTQLTQYFAGIVPMEIMPAPSNTTGLPIPTFYIGGQEDTYGSVFPHQSISSAGVPNIGSSNNADRMLSYLFGVNDIRDGEYIYSATAANRYWGLEFDAVEVIQAEHGKGVITVNSLESNDGVVYTKLVNTSALAHNIFADHAQYAWDFISQFSRNTDGTISKAYVPTAGRVDLAPTSVTGGAAIFVYVPDGIDGNAVLTEPILMVYGDGDFTASSAGAMAETSGLGALAKRENSVIAFVNSIGDEWGQADADAYSVYAGGLFAERDNQAGGGRWDAATNRYSNGKYSGYTGHRYYAIADGAGADFVSAYLVDDALETAYGWGGSTSAMPANIMLFNTTAVPAKGTIDFEYPAIIVNGSTQVNGQYAALNKKASRVVTLASNVTEGFDNAVLAAQFDKLISVRRSNVGGTTNNTAIFDVPVYSALGVEVIEKTVTLGTASRMYLTYLPGTVKHAATGTIPLVLALHGGGEKAEYFALLSAWPEVAAKEGFIVVAVDNHTAINNDQLIELLEGVFADYPQVDRSRVYASGFSMGSMHSLNLGTQLTQYFAGIVPMECMPALTGATGLPIPTFYIGGQEDTYPSVFPSHNAGAIGSPNDADRVLNHLFGANDIRDGQYTYSTAAPNPWWGVEFDAVETVQATHGKSVITINSLESNDGVVYTKLVNTSALSHNILADHMQYAWDFISQFSRKANGSISVAPPPLELEVTVAPRCMGGKAYLAVVGKNADTVPANVELNSVFGAKTVATVAPGKSASVSFPTSVKNLGPGAVTVTGKQVGGPAVGSFTRSYEGLNCG